MNLSKLPQGEAADALLSASFNQDASCFATGTDQGFRIFNANPLTEKTRREYVPTSTGTTLPQQHETDAAAGDRKGPDMNQPGGIALVEMLYRTNYLALVGGGRNPKFPPNKVVVWDDALGKVAFQIEFLSEVKAVRLRRDR